MTRRRAALSCSVHSESEENSDVNADAACSFMEELEALIVPVLGQAEIASSAVEDDLQDDSQPSTAAVGGKKVRSRESDTPGSLSHAARGDEDDEEQEDNADKLCKGCARISDKDLDYFDRTKVLQKSKRRLCWCGDCYTVFRTC